MYGIVIRMMQKRSAAWLLVFCSGMLAASMGASMAAAQPAYPPHAAIAYPTGEITVEFDGESGDYNLQNQAVDPPIVYQIKTNDSLLKQGHLSLQATVDERQRMIPCYVGGFYVRNASGQMLNPKEAASPTTSELIAHVQEGNRVIFDYADVIDGERLTKRYTFELVGNTLVMDLQDTTATETQARYVAFAFETPRYLRNGKIIDLPGVPFPIMQAMDAVFVSTYVDPFRSNLSGYEITRQNPSSIRASASNTPAWMNLVEGKPRWPMHVRAYLTIDPEMLNVLPTKQHRPNANRLQNARSIIELSEQALAAPENMPYGLVRRWVAPANGTIDLEGQFSLRSEESAFCEVTLIETANPETPRSLFTQFLQTGEKDKTAIRGRFPVQEGDQLLFTHRGPAVMQGGALGIDITLYLGDQQYASLEHFGPNQGEMQWYYEEIRQGRRSPLLWNPQAQRWESPTTRAFQAAGRMVNRSGPRGDAFARAERFFDDLNALGFSQLGFVMPSWDDYAAAGAVSADATDPQTWGSQQSLDALMARQEDAGNQVMRYVPKETLLSIGQQSIMQSAIQPAALQEEGKTPMEIFVENTFTQLQDYIRQTSKQSGAMVQVFSPYDLALIQRRSLKPQMVFGPLGSQKMLSFTNSLANETLAEGMPLLLDMSEPDLQRFSPLLQGETSGVLAPLASDEQYSMVVDAALELFPLGSGVGLGGYGGFSPHHENDAPIDPRFYPFSDYLTSTVMFGRVPHLSDALWHTQMTYEEWRNQLVVALSLVYPVAAEYLAPGNQVEAIDYVAGVDERLRIEELIRQDRITEASRIIIRYANGLHVFANRDDQAWDARGSGLTQDRIQPGGFLAVNAQSGLLVLMGERFGRPFAASMTDNRFFLHSQDERLIEFGPYATDGLCMVYDSAWTERPNVILMNAREVLRADSLAPVMRSNERISAELRWTSPAQATVKITDAQGPSVMLELFALPNRLLEAQSLRITQIGPDDSTDVKEANWRMIEAGAAQGIRIGGVQTGQTFRIELEPRLESVPGS